jgi:DNA-binding transcriptional LysR family regulator
VAPECAVRDTGFTRARAPGAVSRQVASLEDWLGRTLFDRSGAVAEPTAEARALAAAADTATQGISEVLAGIGAGAASLRVRAPATFAMRWLIPRLWDFSSRQPELSVNVIQSHSGEPLERFDVDGAIRRAGDCPPGARAVPFPSGRLGLVVGRRCLGRGGARAPVDRRRVPMLASRSRGGEFVARLRAAGQPMPARGRRTFGHFYVALAAAISGEGALVAPVRTIGALLDAGTLAEPRPEVQLAAGDIAAFCGPGAGRMRSAEAFVAWLCRAAGSAPARRAAGPSPGIALARA